MKYDKDKFKVYTWKHWMKLHWILNPALAINELILGQRVPKVSLEYKTTTKPRFERSIIPCPHCNTHHDGRVWSTENGRAFKNWFGLYCSNCGHTIPCLTNGLSFVLLAITFPIWGWFRQSLKARWLKKQPKRYEKLDIDFSSNSYDDKSWLASGLSWSAFMFVLMEVIFPLLTYQQITLKRLSLGIVIWSIGGLAFGYTMKIFMNKTGTSKRENS